MTFTVAKTYPFGKYGVALFVSNWPPSHCGSPVIYVEPDPQTTFERRVRRASDWLIEQAEEFVRKYVGKPVEWEAEE